MPTSKGEDARRRILKAVLHYESLNSTPPGIEDIHKMTGIRSFDALGRHVKELRKQGLVEFTNHSRIKIAKRNTAE